MVPMHAPLITIITPCLNRAAYVKAALDSVQAQRYPNYEHIVMDGGSTDGTLDILSHYPRLTAVCEPDHGMYDAINKGIGRAQGEIIGLLNTDDLYAEGCFQAVADVFEQNPDALAVVGGVSVFTEEENGRSTIETVAPIEPGELWYRLIQGHPVTNAWFFKREVFERWGGFDDQMRWSADRFYLIRIALDGGVRPVPIHRTLYQYRSHPGSVTLSSLDSRDPGYGLRRVKVLQEDIRALAELLDRKDLPVEVRKRTRREHGERCYRLAATAGYHLQVRTALEAVTAGFRRDPFWLFIFLQMAGRRLKIEIVRKHA